MLYLIIFLENQQSNLVNEAPGSGVVTGNGGQHRSGAAPESGVGIFCVGRPNAADTEDIMVVFIQPTPHIIGINCIKTADTNNVTI
jgi:hypothetical protein